MPAGKKSKNRQKRRRRRQKALMEKSCRDRDGEINAVLNETDILAYVSFSGNASSLWISCDSFETVSPFDSVDSSARLLSSAADPGRPLFTNSTPKKRGAQESCAGRIPTPPTLYLSTSESPKQTSQLSDSQPVPTEVLDVSNLVYNTQYFLSVIPSFFSKFCKWLKAFFMPNQIHAYENLTERIVPSNPKHQEDLNLKDVLNENVVTTLNKILEISSRLESKQELLLERVGALERKVELLGGRSLSSEAPPPPPPPPPPSLDLLPTTPVSRGTQPVRPRTVNLPPRPSITVQDILSVRLKTPRPVERSPQVPSERGPLVSVDMLRAVKLKPADLRRRSIDRPRHSPSSAFKTRSP